jgi:uncharacterized protein involved in type VI secretion and phage assembly
MNENGRSLRGQMLGVALGTVTETDDRAGLGRVKVKYDLIKDSKGEPIETDWLQVVSPFAREAYGMFFLPEKDARALLAFADGDPSSPYVLGFLWDGVYLPPIPKEQQQDVRVIRTRSGKRIVFTDPKSGENNTESPNSIEIVDEAGNSILIDTKGKTITIQSKNDMTIKAAGTLTLEAKKVAISTGSVNAEMTETGMTLKGGETMNLNATQINLNCD